jgi:hypothetical protein
MPAINIFTLFMAELKGRRKCNWVSTVKTEIPLPIIYALQHIICALYHVTFTFSVLIL